MVESVLTIDVGSGTQDILLYQAGKNIENCPRMVMPSRTQIVAAEIRRATARRRDIYLHGELMGGGASTVALKQHLAAGLKAYATRNAALSFNDNLAVVQQMGMEFCEEQPSAAVTNWVPVWLGDIDQMSLRQALAAFNLNLPEQFAIAVQDHGFAEAESNRTLRFRLWSDFVLGGGDLKNLVFTQEIPAVYTRMQAVRRLLPGAVVTDTGTAALLGIMVDPKVEPHLDEGIIAVNIGNSHTLAAAIKGRRVYGIFEQHTGMLDVESLQGLVERFRAGQLTNDEVFDQGGHGATLHPEMGPGWSFVAVTGPRRALAKSLGWYEASPYGDMMLTGCFGLLRGLNLL